MYLDFPQKLRHHKTSILILNMCLTQLCGGHGILIYAGKCLICVWWCQVGGGQIFCKCRSWMCELIMGPRKISVKSCKTDMNLFVCIFKMMCLFPQIRKLLKNVACGLVYPTSSALALPFLFVYLGVEGYLCLIGKLQFNQFTENF